MLNCPESIELLKKAALQPTKQKKTSSTLSIEYPEYGRSAKIRVKTREALLKDFN